MAPKGKDLEPETKLLLGRPRGTLKMGLVGLPNVGKSTTFNVLCQQAVPAANFPFCTIDPHEARMNVPDERFQVLCDHFKPKSQVPATLSIFDIAGLVPGAHAGEGLGNAFLSHIQSVDGIYHVVRVFDDVDITHTEGEINPVNDLQTIHDELRLKDIQRCEQLIEETSKIVSRGQIKDKAKKAELEMLEIALTLLKDEKRWISDGSWKQNEVEILNGIQFLTAKPVIYLVNMSEKDFIRQKNPWLSKINQWVKEHNPGPIIPYCANVEMEMAALDQGQRAAYLKSKNIQKSMLQKIIVSGYNTLNLIHFFTCGEDEVKCWTIRKNTKAPQAAGTIHTDFEKGFICAEVYTYENLVQYGSEAQVKAEGKYQQKGKNYVVEDGDIIFFKFNVSSGGKK